MTLLYTELHMPSMPLSVLSNRRHMARPFSFSFALLTVPLYLTCPFANSSAASAFLHQRRRHSSLLFLRHHHHHQPLVHASSFPPFRSTALISFPPFGSLGNGNGQVGFSHFTLVSFSICSDLYILVSTVYPISLLSFCSFVTFGIIPPPWLFVILKRIEQTNTPPTGFFHLTLRCSPPSIRHSQYCIIIFTSIIPAIRLPPRITTTSCKTAYRFD